MATGLRPLAHEDSIDVVSPTAAEDGWTAYTDTALTEGHLGCFSFVCYYKKYRSEPFCAYIFAETYISVDEPFPS